MKVLFLQHVGVLGGSSRSLLELINKLPKDVEVSVLCPQGEFAKLLTKKGIEVHTIIGMPQFNNIITAGYHDLRWLILIRESFYFPFLFFKILSLKNKKYDLVHVNETTQIYSLILSNKLLTNKIVLHSRSLMLTKKNLRYKYLTKIYKKYASHIISIDETVKSTLDNSLNVSVIHNGVDTDNIHLKKITTEKFIVGIVANFQRVKGILEFVDAANICINKKKLNIQFHIYGAEYNNTKGLKEKIFQLFGFREDIDSIVKNKLKKYSLGESLVLKGFVQDHNQLYNNIDLLAIPGYVNATGRPVFEAGFYKVPAITTMKNQFQDTFIDNVTGISIEIKSANSLAQAIEKLYLDRGLLQSMGEESYKLSKKLHTSNKNSLEVYKLYQKLIAQDRKE